MNNTRAAADNQEPQETLYSLHTAALNNKVDEVRKLLEAGEDIDRTAAEGYTPLHHAIYSNSVDTTRFLLERGANPMLLTKSGASVFHIAVALDTPDIIKILASTPAVGLINEEERASQRTPLEMAAAFRNINSIRALVEAGASVNRLGPGGFTALHHVMKTETTDRLETIKALVELGADITKAAANDLGNTPLHLAARSKGDGDQLTEYLLKHCFNGVSAVNHSNETPLHMAVGLGKHRTVELLIEAGADINAVSKTNITPLYFAAARNALDDVRLLLEKGADPHIQTTGNLYPEAYSNLQEIRDAVAGARAKSAGPKP